MCGFGRNVTVTDQFVANTHQDSGADDSPRSGRYFGEFEPFALQFAEFQSRTLFSIRGSASVMKFSIPAPSCETPRRGRNGIAGMVTDQRPTIGLRPDQRRWLMGGLMVGLFLSSTEQSVVATALPTMAGELGGGNRIAWVVSAYLLTSTVATPLYGKMSDLFGRRIVYQTSISIFLV